MYRYFYKHMKNEPLNFPFENFSSRFSFFRFCHFINEKRRQVGGEKGINRLLLAENPCNRNG
jgi:hypothetical protein